MGNKCEKAQKFISQKEDGMVSEEAENTVTSIYLVPCVSQHTVCAVTKCRVRIVRCEFGGEL